MIFGPWNTFGISVYSILKFRFTAKGHFEKNPYCRKPKVWGKTKSEKIMARDSLCKNQTNFEEIASDPLQISQK